MDRTDQADSELLDGLKSYTHPWVLLQPKGLRLDTHPAVGVVEADHELMEEIREVNSSISTL